MNQYLRVFVSATIPCWIVCAAVAPWIFGSIFGQASENSATLFQILLISAAVTVVPALLSPYFLGQLERPGLASVLAWGRAAFALGLTLSLASPYGAVGVAIALVIADVCFTATVLLMYLRFARTEVASAVMPRTQDLSLVYSRARALLRGFAV